MFFELIWTIFVCLKRNEYLKAFTGKYSADKCLGSSIPETTSFLLEMLRAHEKCGKPLPFSTINFTEGFIEIQNQCKIFLLLVN